MRTIFITGLYSTTDQRALYDWIVSQGFLPEDVMIVSKPGRVGGNHALARFETERDAAIAAEGLDHKFYNREKHGVRVFLSTSELVPPTDPRWDGKWLNWQPAAVRNTVSRNAKPQYYAPQIKREWA